MNMKDAYKRMLLYFRKRPDRAAEILLGQQLIPIQRVMLFVGWYVPFTFFIITRGGGKTFVLALLCILRGLLYSNQRIGIIAASYRQSKMVFNEIRRIYQQSKILQDSCVKPPVVGTDNCYLLLKNGSEIEALPLGDGGKIRGARYYFLVIDERAQIPKDILDKVIIGMTATVQDPLFNVKRQKILDKYGVDIGKYKKEIRSNHIISASTAFYQFNHLWETISSVVETILKRKVSGDNNREIWKDYAIIKASYEIYPKGFMNEATIEHAKQTMSSLEFAMEYKCFFPPESGGFFPPQVVLNAVAFDKNANILLKGLPDKKYVLFVDPARTEANCAFVIIEIDDGRGYHLIRYIDTLNNVKHQDMALKIWNLLHRFNIVRIAMDAGGGGKEIKDLLCDPSFCPPEYPLIYDFEDLASYEDERKTIPKKGRHILHMVPFTSKFLYDANHSLLSAFERRNLLFPRLLDSDDLHNVSKEEAEELERIEYEIQQAKQEILSIIVTVTPKGYPTWTVPKRRQLVDRYDAILGGYMEVKSLMQEEISSNDIDLPIGGWSGTIVSHPIKGFEYHEVASLAENETEIFDYDDIALISEREKTKINLPIFNDIKNN